MRLLIGKHTLFSLALAGILSCCPHASSADAGRELSWKWNRGQTRRYDIRISRNQTTGDTEIFRSELDLRMLLSITAIDRSEDGPLLEIAVERLKVDQRAGKTRASYDSESASSPTARSAWQIGAEALMFTPAIVIQYPTGDSLIEQGWGSVLKEAYQASPGASPRKEFAIQQLFGDQGLKNMLNSIFGLLPADGSSSDNTWKDTEEVDLALGMKVLRNCTHTLRETDSVQAAAVIEIRGRIESAQGEPSRIELPKGTAEVEILQSTIEGQSIFSIESGALREHRSEGEMTIRTVLFDAGREGGRREVHARLREIKKVKLLENSKASQ